MGPNDTPEGDFNERALTVVRRFGHDLRNALNAMEMEACHLDLLVMDGVAKESLLRLRKQMALTEKKLRALTIRFVAPERVPVPVIDLFTKWNSRALSAFPGSAVTWNCAAKNEVIHVDMAMLADALGEMLFFYKRAPVAVTVGHEEGEVRFRVEWSFPDRDTAVQRVPALPEFGTVISGNGGRYMERACDVSGEAVCECAFPLHG